MRRTLNLPLWSALAAGLLLAGASGIETDIGLPVAVPAGEAAQHAQQQVPLVGETLELEWEQMQEATQGLEGAELRSLLQSSGCSTDNSPAGIFSCINAVRQNPSILTYSCSFSVSPATPVAWDEQLGEAARLHSEDQANNNQMSHYGSDGSTLSDRAERAGFPPNSALGENVATGHTAGDHLVHDWMCSEGHRRTNMNCRYDTVGVGTAFSVQGRFYYTALFGCRNPPCSCGASQPVATPQATAPPAANPTPAAPTPAAVPAATPASVPQATPGATAPAGAGQCGAPCTANGNLYSYCNAASGNCEACGLQAGQVCCPQGHSHTCHPGMQCSSNGLCEAAAGGNDSGATLPAAAAACGRDCTLNNNFFSYCNPASGNCEACGMQVGAVCCPEGYNNRCAGGLICGAGGVCTPGSQVRRLKQV